jgi:hypothetical protein
VGESTSSEGGDEERTKLLALLRQAEAQIKAGQAIDYDPKTFKDRLLAIYRRAHG